jgi:glycosyltransferase involved in cell wall biosynthesis
MIEAPISVIVPVYNGVDYVGDAIRSLLEQTRPASEIIVVDDGSSDSTASVVKSFGNRVRLIIQKNQGAAVARNTGISAASQPYIAWLDHDDLATPRRFEVQLAAFEATPAPDVVFGAMTQFISAELSVEAAAALRCDERPQPSPLPSCFMAPRVVFDRIGMLPCDSEAEFVAWYMRAIEEGLRIAFVPDVIAHRRIHGANQSFRNDGVRRAYLRIVKASLDRRRRRGATTGGA